ncbi:16S rRNA (cytosine(967)-C(5))-methyltransferase, partial [Endozoicomonas sp.]|nr:16S rRNA (cytosine(967)-C(5))-methyltransferase [Endozoicomonas sp.]
MAKQSSVRLAAAKVVTKVAGGESLNTALPPQQALFSVRDQSLLAELSYGTLRHYLKLQAWL